MMNTKMSTKTSTTSTNRSNKRNIQPGQVKNKGVTRIINGPKKNAIVKTKVSKTDDLVDQIESQDKPTNVYDRLYNSRPSKERTKSKLDSSKSAKKIVKNSSIVTQKRYTPTKTPNRGKSYTQYTGYVSHVNRSKALTSDRVFSLSDDSRDGMAPHVRTQRKPTPVAPKKKPLSTSQPISVFGENTKSEESKNLFGSNLKVPKFASENPSCRSMLSDNVDSHALTDLDDIELDDDLNSIVLNIKKQNDNLKTKIHVKNQEKIEKAGTMSPEIQKKIIGVPLDAFQTPKTSKFKSKVSTMDQLNSQPPPHVLNTVIKNDKDSTGKYQETDDGDFEREETIIIDSKLNLSSRLNQVSEVSSHNENQPDVDLLSYQDSVLLKSCMKRLSDKLKLVQKENQRLQFEKYQDILKYQKLLDEANLKVEQMRKKNNQLNKKLMQAIVSIKMSCFSSDLNKNDTDGLIYQLQHENVELRSLLKVHQKFSNRKELEDIIRSQEYQMRNKDNFCRSRSLQFSNKKRSSNLYNIKKDDFSLKDKGKTTDGKLQNSNIIPKFTI